MVKKNTQKTTLISLLSAMGLFSAACAAPSLGYEGLEDQNAGSINSYLQGIDPLAVPAPYDQAGELVPGSETAEDTGYSQYTCQLRDMSKSENRAEVVAYQANSESLFAGAIVRPSALDTGLLNQIALPRAPLRIALAGQTFEGQSSDTIEVPDLGSVNESVARMVLASTPSQTVSSIVSRTHKITSKEQLSFAIGAKVTWMSGSVGASFKWDNTQVSERFLIELTQAYYTVNVVPPTSGGAGFFDSSVTVNDLRRATNGEPPLYVSSITYGRKIFISVENTSSTRRIGATLNASFGVGTSVAIDTALNQLKQNGELKVEAYVIGGSAADATRAITDIGKVNDLINNGATLSRQSPGAPIAYKLAYLRDNSNAMMNLTDDYKIKECHKVSSTLRVRLNAISCDECNDQHGEYLDTDQGVELWGTTSVDSIFPAGRNPPANALLTNQFFNFSEAGALDFSSRGSYDTQPPNWTKDNYANFTPLGNVQGSADLRVFPGVGGVLRFHGALRERDSNKNCHNWVGCSNWTEDYYSHGPYEFSVENAFRANDGTQTNGSSGWSNTDYQVPVYLQNGSSNNGSVILHFALEFLDDEESL